VVVAPLVWVVGGASSSSIEEVGGRAVDGAEGDGMLKKGRWTPWGSLTSFSRVD
jgi:hypothetical protein